MANDLFSPVNTNTQYDYHYKRLNPEQKQAVDQTEGPVMVIAGPGTGKTQILAVRIAKILIQPDIHAHNILCLTYTDSASLAMRNRLIQIIGPEAHRINIFSFHAFCNQVIQDNLGYFSDYRQLEAITDLERVGLYKELIRQLPKDHRLKRLKGDPTYEMKRLQHLFSLMKKENYTAEIIEKEIDIHLEERKNADDMIYKRSGKGYTKGAFKQKAYDEIVRKMEELRAGALLFDTYQEMMQARGRYDFDDMILWVVRAFENSDDLLADYQERYQYFLVDEFQDTNGSQKKLVDLMVSYWGDEPNIFVVGDDDQAIFKFQGANLGNIKEFARDYKPTMVVLTKNYRSSQKILNASMKLIEYNTERITNDSNFQLDKNLEAKGSHSAIQQQVSVETYSSISQEQADIADQIVKAHEAGQDLSKMAVLYRSHRQIDKLMTVLETHKIPVNVKRRIDVLKLPLIQNLLQILRYVSEQYNVKGYTDRKLFELMHYNHFEISSHDIAALVWETRNKEDQDKLKTPLSKLIADEDHLDRMELKTTDKIKQLSRLLDKWIADVNDVTLQVLFQNIINEGKVLEYVLQKHDKSWQLQVIGTLFDLIKEETAKQPDLKLHDFMHMIDEMISNSLPLMVNKILHANNGLQFMTSHASKGLEFDKVFIIGTTKDVWDKKANRRGQFTFPAGLNADVDDNTEDERRLMYVAMTRAERELQLSYGLQKENGTGLGASQFIDELRETPDIDFNSRIIAEDVVIDFQSRVLSQQDVENKLIDKDLVDRRLQGYKLSVTELNKYLKCPASNVEIINYFMTGMNRHKSHFTAQEYEDMTAYGETVLKAYYEEYLTDIPLNVTYRLEEKVDNVEIEGIPIKGVLDRATVHKDYVEVVDYKTANPTSTENRKKIRTPDAKKPEGGEYWRQIVFYKLLCLADRKNNWNMTRGTMDFVEPDRKTGKFTRVDYVVSPKHIDIVTQQIKETWAKIHNYEFDKGCGEENCHWCGFLTRIEA